jgi:hypothetical protein
VDIALLVSAIAAVICLAIVLLGRRPTRLRAGDAVAAAGAAPLPIWRRPVSEGAAEGITPSWPAVAGAALAAALLVQPLAAAPAAAVVLAARRLPLIGRLAPPALVAAGAALVVGGQLRHDHPAAFAWPTQFLTAHRCAALAAVLLLVLSIDERRRGPAPDYGRGALPATIGSDP